MKDFRYILSPQFAYAFLGLYNYRVEKMMAYGYLMRHQFCPIEVYTPYDIVSAIKAYFPDCKEVIYNEDTDDYTVHGWDGKKEDIDELISSLCFAVTSYNTRGNDMTFSIKTIFSDEEIDYNRKRFNSYYC